VEHAVSADGTRIGWEVAGAGAPLVLLHGSVADRGRWAAVRDGLARRFTLHLVDRRGRGLSRAEAEGPYALAREAEDVAAVLGVVGPGALVLAHSYGGTCALEAAAAGAPMARLLVYEPAFGTDAGPVFPDAALADVEAALARGDLEAALEVFGADVLLLPAPEIAAMRGTPAWRPGRVRPDPRPRGPRRERLPPRPRSPRGGEDAGAVPPRHGNHAGAHALDPGRPRRAAGQRAAGAARPRARGDGRRPGAVRRRGGGLVRGQPLMRARGRRAGRAAQRPLMNTDADAPGGSFVGETKKAGERRGRPGGR
jgi:pimeloyl-ACP methyl ester carboxylesterase